MTICTITSTQYQSLSEKNTQQPPKLPKVRKFAEQERLQFIRVFLTILFLPVSKYYYYYYYYYVALIQSSYADTGSRLACSSSTANILARAYELIVGCQASYHTSSMTIILSSRTPRRTGSHKLLLPVSRMALQLYGRKPPLLSALLQSGNRCRTAGDVLSVSGAL